MGSSPPDSSKQAQSTSPPQQSRNSPRSEPTADTKTSIERAVKSEPGNNTEVSQPLAPPPKPSQVSNTPDYFSGNHGSHLSYEPNPFEQQFGGGGTVETPGGTKLPSVAALTSPAPLLAGSGATPFPWGSSLRTGPLSPAMLSGPTNDYFNNDHYRGGFPTPNESSLRTGLTPGGGGSMFPPAPSPNSQAILSSLAGSGATPTTLDFHRTAMTAAAQQKREALLSEQQQREQQQAQQQREQQAQQQQQQQAQQSSSTEQPSDASKKADEKSAPTQPMADPFGAHDANDAANGLFLLAHARNQPAQASNYAHAQPQPVQAHSQPAGIQSGNQSQETSPNMANRDMNGGASVGSGRGMSEMSGYSEELEKPRNSRSKAKKGGNTANGRRKAEDTPNKAPASKKSKSNNGNSISSNQSGMEPEPASEEEPDMTKDEYNANGKKMTDEEKRKNFLERNRVAALKCRQRKKQWLQNLQQKVEFFSAENENLNGQIQALREELVNLKTVLLAHKDCPVTQQGVHLNAMNQIMAQADYQHHQMNPYGMASINGQQIMAGSGMQRRFS